MHGDTHRARGGSGKVCFNPQSSKVLTASSDKTARLWDTETGDCLQILEGHTDEIFSCAFNYAGSTIISGSKDNTCRMYGSADETRRIFSRPTSFYKIITENAAHGKGKKQLASQCLVNYNIYPIILYTSLYLVAKCKLFILYRCHYCRSRREY